jgi:hypothetical protein
MNFLGCLDAHHQLADGRWDSAIQLRCVLDNGILRTWSVVPAAHREPFATEAEAVAHNRVLARHALAQLGMPA